MSQDRIQATRNITLHWRNFIIVVLVIILVGIIIGLIITVAILWILRDAARSVFRRLMDAVDPALVADIERVAR